MSGVLEELAAGASGDTTSWFVPGRIEVLGKHTDYAGGRSLLAAVDTGHTITARARQDRVLRARSEGADGTVAIDLDRPEESAADETEGHWGGYVAAVAARLEKNFPGQVRGADVTVTSTLPLAAGMSSSSALVVGLALALIDLSDLAADPAFTREITTVEQFGEYCGSIENGQSFGTLAGERGVGTFGGSQDHTAVLCGVPDALVQYSFCPVRHERTVGLGTELALVVAVSGVEAAKTGAAREAYNRVSRAVSELVLRWQEATGGREATLADAVASAPDAAARLRELAADDEYLVGRLEQFLTESEQIVPAASDALEEGDLAEFGRLVDLSQAGAESGLRNQVPETIALQRLARDNGAHAASAFGAGFGGSVWALVPADGAEQFAADWSAAFRAAHPDRRDATTAITRPGGAARRVR
ncbi:galactokinase [Brachybacterium sp. P6-10-X1]|uniref:galactokinase family protein n=1 Tax=Brachybacterium sp. P6-10-X1 TaxID=1903186 RepID=UPI000971B4B8|nr:galactokinase family protein [Brachybacterium sp. P6-10-X1]APX33852.1 galactokinase [Brachybacterium sp. P6-10-X1]